MKTSYYKKIDLMNQEERDRYYFISISSSIPKWFKYLDEQISCLAPKYLYVKQMKDKEISEAEFTQLYLQDISTINMVDFVTYCQQIEQSTQREVVLLCYESTKFCHRHTLAQYVYQCTNIIIEELT